MIYVSSDTLKIILVASIPDCENPQEGKEVLQSHVFPLGFDCSLSLTELGGPAQHFKRALLFMPARKRSLSQDDSCPRIAIEQLRGSSSALWELVG